MNTPSQTGILTAAQGSLEGTDTSNACGVNGTFYFLLLLDFQPLFMNMLGGDFKSDRKKYSKYLKMNVTTYYL